MPSSENVTTSWKSAKTSTALCDNVTSSQKPAKASMASSDNVTTSQIIGSLSTGRVDKYPKIRPFPQIIVCHRLTLSHLPGNSPKPVWYCATTSQLPGNPPKPVRHCAATSQLPKKVKNARLVYKAGVQSHIIFSFWRLSFWPVLH